MVALDRIKSCAQHLRVRCCAMAEEPVDSQAKSSYDQRFVLAVLPLGDRIRRLEEHAASISWAQVTLVRAFNEGRKGSECCVVLFPSKASRQKL